MGTLTIRLDDKLDRDLTRLAKRSGVCEKPLADTGLLKRSANDDFMLPSSIFCMQRNANSESNSQQLTKRVHVWNI